MIKAMIFGGLLSLAVFGQASDPGALRVGNPPGGIGGACGISNVAYLTSTGSIVTCQSHVWTVLSGGGGGGSAAALTDFGMTLSGAVETMGATCTALAPCHTKLGQWANACAATLVSGSGSAIWYLDNVPSVKIAIPAVGMSVTATGLGCSVVTGTSVPAGAIPLWITTATIGVWDTLTGPMDQRSWLWADNLLSPGTGCVPFTTLSGVTTINCPGTATYLPSWRPAVTTNALATYAGSPWVFNFVNGGYVCPGNANFDDCAVIFNTLGGIGTLKVQWDGTTTLSTVIKWGVNAGAGTNVTWNVSCAPVLATGTINTLVFSTPSVSIVAAPTVGNWTSTTIAVPMGSGAGSCAATGAGQVAILIQTGSFVAGTPYFYGVTL